MDKYLTRGAYVLGAICIVLLTLALGWIIVWKFLLSKIKFIRELLDLNPTKPAGPTAADAQRPTTFDERLRQYKENPHRRHTGSSLTKPTA
ncbi:Aste57867_8174 [Aphanomyces stellatus]|uniref:Aste57867_8174 protein n=1 Tax=Aphanomyces stellatus TaxID=120398 RepID=A0A485KJJ5_9STRA|nr:hypothetical protein As57867_008144 [Aphanomyces stellatus]VFT85062.1 Aste57867_8174 [Aphanomyces stellatus]